MRIAQQLQHSLGRLSQRSLPAQLPQWRIYHGMVLHKDGKAEVGVRLEPPSGSLLTDQTRTQWALHLKELLHSVVPEGERFRLMQRVGQHDGGDLEAYQAELGHPDPLSLAVTQARVEHFREMVAGDLLVGREVYAFCTFGEKRLKGAAFSPSELSAYLRQGVLLQDAMAAVFRRMQTEATPLDIQAAYALMDTYFNPDESGLPSAHYGANWVSYPSPMLRRLPELRPPTLKARLGRGLVNNAFTQQLGVGESWIRILNLYTQPERCPLESGELLSRSLLGKRGWLVLDMIHLPYETAVQSFRTRSRVWSSFRSQAEDKGDYVDESVESGADELKAFLRHLNDTGDRIYSVGIGLVLIGKEAEKLGEKSREALGDLGEIPGRPFRAIGEGLFETWRNLSPFSGKANDERVILTESNCANLIPKLGPYRGSAKAKGLFHNRHWTLTRFDLLDPVLGNRNYAIAGESGTGKSYTAQRLLLDALRDPNVEVFTVDAKDTYQTLASAVMDRAGHTAGVYLEFSLEGATCLNPLELAQGQLEPDAEELDFMVRLLHCMAVAHSDPTQAALEQSLLAKALTQTYRRKVDEVGIDGAYQKVLQTPLLRDVDQTLKAMQRDPALEARDREVAHGLSLRLQFWLLDNPGGRLFDRPSNIRLEGKRLIGFDLSALVQGGQQSTLASLTMMLVAHHIWKRVRNLGKSSVVHFDEAWLLLRDPEGVRVVESLQRLIRSYGGAVGLVVHDPKDLDQPGIETNVSTFFLHPFEDQGRFLENWMHQPPEVPALHRSLGFERGIYSEALLLRRAGGVDSKWEGGVVVVTASALEHWLFTSHDADKRKRAGVVERFGGDLLAALKHLAEGGKE